MMRIYLLLTCLLIGASLRAQTAEDSVKAVIESFFAGMNRSDTVAIKAVFAENAVLQTIGRDKTGALKVQDEKLAGFLKSIGAAKSGSLDERITFSSVLIDGPMASVWTPYNFYYEGKFSHCGVNSFQMVRWNSGWKIQYVIDTRRRDGCTQ